MHRYQPTQPPHPPLVVDIPSGYPEVSGDSDTPDIANIYRDFSVDVMPLASVSGSGVDVVSNADTTISVSTSGAYADLGSTCISTEILHWRPTWGMSVWAIQPLACSHPRR